MAGPASRWASGLARAARWIRREPALGTATIVMALLVGLALLGPVFWGEDPLAVDPTNSLLPPSGAHPMGTDGVGRDVFARFNQGARISLAVGALVVLAGAAIGGVVGLVAGALAGWRDTSLMLLMNTILAFPPLILAMAVTVGLRDRIGLGLTTAALGIMLTSVPYYARLLRSDVLRIRSLPFIEAAAALGASRKRIIARHIAPHVVSTLLIQAAAVFGYAVLSLAALGFVGLGAQVPTPEWGTMITDGLQYAPTGQWWVGVFPGLGVLVVTTAASVIADRMRDILDPRGRYAHV